MGRRGTRAAALAAAAAVALAAARRRRSHQTGAADRARTHDVAVRARTRNQRRAELARLGGRAGTGYAVHRARRVFASAERQVELDQQFELRTAEQVAEALGGMKGAFMKLGQMASYLDVGLPAHAREALAGLQQDAPPMSAALAAGVIERELGAPPEQVFLEWDPAPLASASIGQVHRAITRDGRAVAVKVQYPGIDDAIRADLDAAGTVFGAAGLAFPGFDPGPLVEEIRARVVEELDYANEAYNQQLFADSYRDHPYIHVPDVVTELSTPRVLTTDLAEGVRFEVMATWDDDERNLAAETIYRFVFRSLYRLNAFNGDPHPGNYLFQPGGRVTFLDFGLVKHFTQHEIDLFGDMIRALVMEGDTARYRRIIEQIGLLKPGTPVSDDQVHDYFSHFYEFVLHDEEVTITPQWSADAASRYFDPSGPYGPILKAANLPASFVIIQRINLGLMAILGDLGATGNFRRIAEELWPWVDGPPSTPMGKAEADWLADVLADTLAATGTSPDVEGCADDTVDHLRVVLDDAARTAALVGGWTADDPLRLTKAVVTWLLRCPRRALAGGESGATDDLVAGLVVDAAAKLATLVPQRAPTVDAALAYLEAVGDTTVADHLAGRGDAAAPLLDDLSARVEGLARVWPQIDPAWWPRVEEPVRARLAGGAVVVGGRLDLLLGGEPTDRPAVVVEVKGGRWYDGMRADGHLYALLVALRAGHPPAAVVTVVADGTTHIEPVRPAVLATTAERVERALQVAAAIAAGEPAATHPGPHCGHCPARPDCTAGLDWRPEALVAG